MILGWKPRRSVDVIDIYADDASSEKTGGLAALLLGLDLTRPSR